MTTGTPFTFEGREITWRQFRALEGVYYHILGVDVAAETVDWLMKFEPGRACMMHRHIGPTKTFVLAGEHHVYEPDGQGGHRHIGRKAGAWAVSDGDNVHYESGGDTGGVIYLCMAGREGVVYDILNDALESERAISIHDFKRGYDKAAAGR
ncbi:MAG: hypothetical protein EXQ87_09990 [Alphaproteobacteria bacterium]|nr:hypothetical protein [Alphaproteobacteria bacterium]